MTMHFVVTLNQGAHKYHSSNERMTKSHLSHSHLFTQLVVHPTTNFEVNIRQYQST